MGAGIASGVLGSVGGIVTGLMGQASERKIAKKGRKLQVKLHEESAAERKRLSDKFEGHVGLAEQNLLRGETARARLYSSLGTPGSYDIPSQTPGPIDFQGIRPVGLGFVRPGEAGASGSAFTSDRYREVGMVTGEDVRLGKGARYKGTKPWEVEGELLDPDKMVATAQDSAGFRTVSRMVAEAEQLAARKGPLWEQMNNSVVGGIYESNAAFQRQQMEAMSRGIARGGTARRVGLQMAQAYQVQEGINRQRTGQLWQSKMQLEEYRTEYAQNVTGFAQAWVNNAAGMRDGFTNALQNLQLFWANTMAPTLAGATVNAQSATQSGIQDSTDQLIAASRKRADAISTGVQGLIKSGEAAWGQWGPQDAAEAPTSGIA